MFLAWRKHIARVMFYETLMTGTGGIVTGVLLGILVSKLMILLLLKIVKFKATFGFEVPVEAIGATVILFGAIFILNLVYNYSQVHRTKPAELLKSPTWVRGNQNKMVCNHCRCFKPWRGVLYCIDNRIPTGSTEHFLFCGYSCHYRNVLSFHSRKHCFP